ncbi:Di-copper centre-containing protein [Durotheca rogersii]|uniref:Di-copper centre-containing protein n=1 Tax=Durotheca rogersii TaxID=419775 RepID=UPI002220FECD|nr:Di-copper centre-containing protein [Durotheca rogersii]KAI5861017.1 Di-copper centre-containing protein [Durotheca rogersii]
MLPRLTFLVGLLLIGVDAGPLQKRFRFERPPSVYPPDIVDKLEEEAISKFEEWVAKNPAASGCTLETAREEYISAVLCLQNLPAKAPKDKFPGARSRYDDFAHLLPAHRYFIWVYETALRDECGYTGYQPYWNYDRYAADPINSPLFNGNASSMGGNGAPSEYPGVRQMGFKPPYDIIPSAGGGGMVVSLGPLSTIVSDIPPNPQKDGLGSNPRCLRRDVNKYSASVTTADHAYKLITESPDIETFQKILLGQPDKNDWGIHTGGHYTIGGDPGGDFFASPGDPVFYFHHGAIDRFWWIWQMQDPDNRMYQYPGQTLKSGQTPDEFAEKDVININWLAPNVTVKNMMTNIGGHDGNFCFIYI